MNSVVSIIDKLYTDLTPGSQLTDLYSGFFRIRSHDPTLVFG